MTIVFPLLYVFAHFLRIFLFYFRSPLHILATSLIVWQLSLRDIFSQLVVCLFSFLMPFNEKKFSI